VSVTLVSGGKAWACGSSQLGGLIFVVQDVYRSAVLGKCDSCMSIVSGHGAVA
jgi:hypothetical protein